MMTSTFLPAAAPPDPPPPPLLDEPPEARPATTPTTSPISAITATSDSENFRRVFMAKPLLPGELRPSVPQPRKRFQQSGHCRLQRNFCQGITFSRKGCTVAHMSVPARQDSATGSPETFSNNNNHARRPTMKEVAALAGVSLATVSRVVNGDGKVHPDLAAKVRDAVRLLGYRRDLTATNLRRSDRQSASLGLVFDDVANPFQAAVMRGIETVARTRDVLPLVGSSDEDPARERELAEAFLSRRVDGLIVVPAGLDHSYLVPERDAGVAIVFVDRPPTFIDADFVVSDNAGGARAATRHLIEHGHGRIGFLGDQERIFTAVERLRGYQDALA